MSLACLVGAVLAYPINWWLVKLGLKHGMGTERALGKRGAHMNSSGLPIHGSPNGQAPMQGMAQVQHEGVSTVQLVSVSLFTVMMLGTGITLAARYGSLSMHRSPPPVMTMVKGR
jgi:hypothetical protein